MRSATSLMVRARYEVVTVKTLARARAGGHGPRRDEEGDGRGERDPGRADHRASMTALASPPVRIRDAEPADWPAIWPFFQRIVIAQETYRV